MTSEYGFDPAELAQRGQGGTIELPTAFIHDLANADSLQKALDSLAHWLSVLFSADRASITIQRSPEELSVYAMAGNRAIPQDCTLPIANTLVGRAFAHQRLLICNDLQVSDELDCRMLSANHHQHRLQPGQCAGPQLRGCPQTSRPGAIPSQGCWTQSRGRALAPSLFAATQIRSGTIRERLQQRPALRSMAPVAPPEHRRPAPSP